MLYKEKIDFLKNISIFKRWSLAIIHEIMMLVRIKTYSRGHVLYEEGDKSKDLFFVRSGEIEVTHNTVIKYLQKSFYLTQTALINVRNQRPFLKLHVYP